MKNKKSILLFIYFYMLALTLSSQYRSTLSPISKEGFYTLYLQTDIMGKAQPDFEDLRIKDAKGKEMAYIIRKDAYADLKNEFLPYPIEVNQTENKNTQVIIHTQGDTISSLTLNIKNADNQKNASLEGSNDKKKWFGVKEEITLNQNFSKNQTHSYLTISFPYSDYLYYRLTINDSLSAPLNITEIGKVSSSYREYRRKQEIPASNLSIKDTARITKIVLDYRGKYNIRNIEVYISAPVFYKRRATIYNKAGYTLFTTELNSNRKNSIIFPTEIVANRIVISIDNQDNQPLTIDSLRTYTDKYFLITYLPEAGNYYLTYGDSTLLCPNYDLAFFEDKIPVSPDELKVLSTEHLTTANTSTVNPFMDIFKKYGIWVVILLIGSQILYIVWKMSKKQTSNE